MFIYFISAPRHHGNKGKKAHNAYSLEVVEGVLTYIEEEAKLTGLPLPAAPGGGTGTPPIFLPSQKCKKEIHTQYIQVLRVAGRDYVRSYRTFVEIWHTCCPHIKFMGLKTDLCDTCDMLRQGVNDAVTEEEKQDALSKYQDHLTVAKAKRDQYNKRIKAAEEELTATGVSTQVASNSAVRLVM